MSILRRKRRSSRVAALVDAVSFGARRLLDRRRAAHRPTVLVTVHPSRRSVAARRGRGTPGSSRRRARASPTLCWRTSGATVTLFVGDNQPYSAKDNVDYTIRRHGRDRGLPHVMIEVRNDLLRAGEGDQRLGRSVERRAARSVVAIGWCDHRCAGRRCDSVKLTAESRDDPAIWQRQGTIRGVQTYGQINKRQAASPIARADKDYFEKRGLQRYAGIWSLWALGVGAVISGHFSGWNFGFAHRRLGRHARRRHHHRDHVSGPRLLHRGNVAGPAAYRRRLFLRPHAWARGAASSPACAKMSNMC